MTRVFRGEPAFPGADVVLYAPTGELVSARPELRPNAPGYDPSGEGRGQRRHTLEHPALDLYNGYDGLLVRTALIRSKDYDSKDLPRVGSARDVGILCHHLIYSPQEHIVTLSLNSSNEVMAIHEAAIGGASTAEFATRIVLQVAFLTSARAMILVHNHPGGTPLPSADDCITTAGIATASACAGIELIDSIIVAQRGFFSFAEKTSDLTRAQDLIPRIHAFRPERWFAVSESS